MRQTTGPEHRSARLRRALRWLGHDSTGSMSIEAVLWIPLFTFLLMLVVDVSNIYLKQSEALRIVQEGNRALSVNRLSSPLEAQLAIAERLDGAVAGAKVTTAISGDVIVTTVKLPLSAMTLSGSLPLIGNTELTLSSRHRVEY
ncbi:Flp pilus assembly protein TadG [Limimaricola variabilis]|uniref:Flp pilus assembly protein TadG n=1 Tax=Limimaricola variabilis TaxID=1492771 RepID=A0ABR6HP62_9RHOB|nr:TadE family protein [Limimaricola variabilis]MBB3712344.1 Flp pilus assembly protein TadG [Limimaricola variabilis]